MRQIPILQILMLNSCEKSSHKICNILLTICVYCWRSCLFRLQLSVEASHRMYFGPKQLRDSMVLSSRTGVCGSPTWNELVQIVHISGMLKSSYDLQSALTHAIEVVVPDQAVRDHYPKLLLANRQAPSSSTLYRHRPSLAMGYANLMQEYISDLMSHGNQEIRWGMIDASKEATIGQCTAVSMLETDLEPCRCFADDLRALAQCDNPAEDFNNSAPSIAYRASFVWSVPCQACFGSQGACEVTLCSHINHILGGGCNISIQHLHVEDRYWYINSIVNFAADVNACVGACANQQNPELAKEEAGGDDGGAPKH